MFNRLEDTTHERERAELWRNTVVAYTATTKAVNVDTVIKWADAILASYDSRFSDPYKQIR